VRRLLSLLLLTALAGAVPGLATAGAPRPPRASIFFYPWYGTPGLDGAYLHWGQNGHAPPGQVASAFYPARGLYSSGDTRVLAAQMREIRAAGLDEVITSWWGWGSLEDQRLQAVLAAARANGLTVAVHVEPYGDRTPTSVAADVTRLRMLGIVDYYVFGAHDFEADAWAAIADLLPPDVRLFAQTGMAGYAAAARFDGLYTYDTLIYRGHRFARLCEQARRKGLVCAPSVGPGYDARRAVGDTRVKPRRAGRTYDGMWSAALAAGADAVTITSYNEWHEGSQIEPARVNGSYLSYEGAWGRAGRAAQRAYVERTAFWAERLRTVLLAPRTS
jgi:glycoprotein endo-alpha-1,2-mannosidase